MSYRGSQEKNTFYIESKFNYNFSKDYNNPTYDVFDEKKLDEIVENIYKEAVVYLDIIIKKM